MQCFIFSLYGSRRVPLAHLLFALSTPSSFASAGLPACSSSLFGRRSLRGSTANLPLKKNCITLTIMQCFIFSLYGSRRVPLAHLLFALSTPSSFASAGLPACSSSLFGRRSLRGSTANLPLKKNCITLTIMQCFIFSLYGSRRVPLAHLLFALSTPSSFASAGLPACSSSLFGRRSLRGSTANLPLKKNCITLTIMQCFIFSLYGSRTHLWTLRGSRTKPIFEEAIKKW